MPPRAIFCLPDYGFDPTEASVPFVYLSEKGCDCFVATEHGKSPACDSRMITGWTGKALGAKPPAREAYSKLTASETFKSPLSWTDPEFSLLPYDILILPGGHDKGMKQIIESESLRSHIREFFPLTKAPGNKVCGAICHGVMALAWTKESSEKDAKSILYERETTTLPLHLERLAVYSTAPVLGDYYRTYAGTWTANEVQASLKSPDQYKPGPWNFGQSYAASAAHVVKDEGYISARWPGDAQVWSEAIWERVSSSQEAPPSESVPV